MLKKKRIQILRKALKTTFYKVLFELIHKRIIIYIKMIKEYDQVKMHDSPFKQTLARAMPKKHKFGTKPHQI